MASCSVTVGRDDGPGTPCCADVEPTNLFTDDCNSFIAWCVSFEWDENDGISCSRPDIFTGEVKMYYHYVASNVSGICAEGDFSVSFGRLVDWDFCDIPDCPATTGAVYGAESTDLVCSSFLSDELHDCDVTQPMEITKTFHIYNEYNFIDFCSSEGTATYIPFMRKFRPPFPIPTTPPTVPPIVPWPPPYIPPIVPPGEEDVPIIGMSDGTSTVSADLDILRPPSGFATLIGAT